MAEPVNPNQSAEMTKIQKEAQEELDKLREKAKTETKILAQIEAGRASELQKVVNLQKELLENTRESIEEAEYQKIGRAHV